MKRTDTLICALKAFPNKYISLSMMLKEFGKT